MHDCRDWAHSSRHTTRNPIKLSRSRLGENSMFIVGAGKALIYPTGSCADPENACKYTELERNTMRTCVNSSEGIQSAGDEKAAKHRMGGQERCLGVVLLYCLHLRGPLMCCLLRLCIALTRHSNQYFGCFRSFNLSADRLCQCAVPAGNLDARFFTAPALLIESSVCAYTLKHSGFTRRAYMLRLRVPGSLEILEKCQKTCLPASVPVHNTQSLCLTSWNIF
jgi:hypothetical protein